METNSLTCQELEFASHTAAKSNSVRKTFLHWLTRVGKFLDQTLFRQDYEPKVWERLDRHGNHYWEVYDPITNQQTFFASDLEVRTWLDNRF